MVMNSGLDIIVVEWVVRGKQQFLVAMGCGARLSLYFRAADMSKLGGAHS